MWCNKPLKIYEHDYCPGIQTQGIRIIETNLYQLSNHTLSDPEMNLVVECLSFAVNKINGCVSALELAYTNTSAKMCASLAHQKLTRDEGCRQKGEQLLVRGIEEVNANSALCFVLEDAKATFTRLMTKPSSQQPPISRQRAESVSQPLAEPNLPSPPDGQKIYSLRQAMDVFSSTSSSFRSVARKMIKRGLVPVKHTQLY